MSSSGGDGTPAPLSIEEGISATPRPEPRNSLDAAAASRLHGMLRRFSWDGAPNARANAARRPAGRRGSNGALAAADALSGSAAHRSVIVDESSPLASGTRRQSTAGGGSGSVGGGGGSSGGGAGVGAGGSANGDSESGDEAEAGGTDQDGELQADVAQLLEKLQGVLPFAALLLLRFLYLHAFGMLFIAGGTVVLMQSDRRLRAQLAYRGVAAPARAVLVAVSALAYLWATYVLVVVVDERIHLWRRLALLPLAAAELPPAAAAAAAGEDAAGQDGTAGDFGPGRLQLLDVLWVVTITDLWARLLVVAVKAVVAALPGSQCLKGRTLCRRRRDGGTGAYAQVGGEAGGVLGEPDLEAGEGGLAAGGQGGAAAAAAAAGAAAGAAAAVAGRAAVHTQAKKRKVFAALEILSLLHRTMMPVPVWYRTRLVTLTAQRAPLSPCARSPFPPSLRATRSRRGSFYMVDAGGEYFAAAYLLFKGLVLASRARMLARALRSVFRSGLEHGRYCTGEEAQAAGDCSICYEAMTQPVKLPCDHMFCEVCLAESLSSCYVCFRLQFANPVLHVSFASRDSEWLERERTCPLCRAETTTTDPLPTAFRDGRTSLLPVVF
ncbi:hypothetical protein JKP88DRAFT_296505 [Tribonema minus]|uniref:RING-type domain-containing protein n=1 Tax=Tribonema minus TaxID=303371 RepID=A0A835ZGZ2_9STRA|nr:hypothetical protein JKP88DRAFT_296505 [Tribonema minus]